MSSTGDEWAADAHHYFRPTGKRMSSAAIIRDGTGRILLVKPSYRPEWLLPGGSIEEDESPLDGCAREVQEELGIALPIGRLLSIEYQAAIPYARPELVKMIFDGGIVDDAVIARFTPPLHEISEVRFVAPAETERLLAPRIRSRTQGALLALERGGTLYLENGRVVA